MKTKTEIAPLVILPNGQLSCTAQLDAFPNYRIFSNGEIFNRKSKKYLKQEGRDTDGYKTVGLVGADGQRKTYRAHRIVAQAFFGPSPLHVDHKDKNRANNLITNLRYVSPQQNQFNKAATNGSTSAYVGVSLHKPTGKWQARIQVNRATISLGSYTTELEAAQAYQRAKAQYHVLPTAASGPSEAELDKALVVLRAPKRVENASTRTQPQKVRL